MCKSVPDLGVNVGLCARSGAANEDALVPEAEEEDEEGEIGGFEGEREEEPEEGESRSLVSADGGSINGKIDGGADARGDV